MDEPKKNSHYESWRWRILGITWLAYVGFYLVRKATFVAPAGDLGILQDASLGVDKPAWGMVLGCYAIAYAVGQIIWGMFADRMGSRKIVLGGMAGAVCVALGMVLAGRLAAGLNLPVIAIFAVLLFAQGLCQATGWPALTKNVSYWFSREERGRVFGVWASNYPMGSTLGALLAGYSAAWFTGWQGCFYVAGGALIAIWILFFIFQRNNPRDVGLPPIEAYHKSACPMEAEADAVAEAQSSAATTLAVLKNPMVIRLGAVYFLLKPLRYVIWGWGPIYIAETLQVGTKDSAITSVVFDLVGPLGIFAAGYASDKIFRTRRIPICVINLVIVAAIMFAFNPLMNQVGGKLMVCALLGSVGFFLFGVDAMISATCAVDFGKKQGAGSAAGVINGLGSTGQIIGVTLPGIVVASHGWGVLFNGLAVCLLLAAMILLPKWNAMPDSSHTSSDQEN